MKPKEIQVRLSSLKTELLETLEDLVSSTTGTQAHILSQSPLDQQTSRLRGDCNQCPGCAKYFNSTGAFDKHRTGQHGVNRRCRTEEEMLDIGMLVNSKGYWVKEKMKESYMQRKLDAKLRKTSDF